MFPLFDFLPSLPWTPIEITMNVVAGMGAILITYGVFLETERRQDAVFMIGSLALLVYSIWIGNKIFSIAMGGLLLGSGIEFIEILMGIHKHDDALVESYKNPKKL